MLIVLLRSRLNVLRNDDFFRGHLPEIRREIVRFVDLSDYFCIIRVPQGFFSMLNPFLHSEMDFEQQKIVIRVNLYRRIPAKKAIS
jgi:hypothetical protein